MGKEKNGSLAMWRKISYGVGNAGGGFVWGIVSSFLLLYCTNIIGVSAAVIGTLLMVARVFDGITDIFMGRIIDLTKSKMGKTRFWYAVSCVPMGVCMYFLFNVPGWQGDGVKYVWIFIFYLLISAVFYTMNQVAYNMMVARVTKNQNDQVTMSSAAMLGGMIGTIIMSSVTSGLLETFGGGQAAWTKVALIYAVVGVLLLLIPVFALKELPEEEFVNLADSSEQKASAGAESVSFIQTILELLKNKYFILMLLLYLVGYINSGSMQSSMVYYATYVLNNAGVMGIFGMCSMIPLIFLMPFVPKFVAKLGMRKACCWGNIVTIAGCIVAVAGHFWGLPVIVAGLLVKGIGSVPGAACYTPFLVKIDEYHYLKTKHRLTGSLFSCSTVGVKIGQGLGTAVCGWIIAWSGFDGQAAVQTAKTNNALFFLYLILPLILTVATGLIYQSMKVEEDIRVMEDA